MFQHFSTSFSFLTINFSSPSFNNSCTQQVFNLSFINPFLLFLYFIPFLPNTKLQFRYTFILPFRRVPLPFLPSPATINSLLLHLSLHLPRKTTFLPLLLSLLCHPLFCSTRALFIALGHTTAV